MCAGFELTGERFKSEVVSAKINVREIQIKKNKRYLPHKASLLEVKLHLVAGVHVVQDHEASARFIGVEFTEVNGLHRESSHRAVII